MGTELIKNLAKDIHKTAKEKGFWDEERSDKRCAILIVSELMEALEADRKNKHADIEKFDFANEEYQNRNIAQLNSKQAFTESFEYYIKDTFEDEIADAFIRCLDWGEARNVNWDKMDIDEAKALPEESISDTLFDVSEVAINAVSFWTLKYGILRLTMSVLSLSLKFNTNLLTHVNLKMQYNSNRPIKHGKAY